MPLDERRTGANLYHCLDWLGQIDAALKRSHVAAPSPRAAPRELLEWALVNWRIAAVPRVTRINVIA